MATLYDFVKVKISTPEPKVLEYSTSSKVITSPKVDYIEALICYECHQYGHTASNCKIRIEQYKKLGLKIEGRLDPLRCLNCNCTGSHKLIIDCKHIICNKCDDIINDIGCCKECMNEAYRYGEW